MRQQFPREFYLPKSAQLTKVTPKQVNAEIYIYDGERSQEAYAIAFAGKAQKPSFHIRFKDASRRAKYLEEWIDGLKQSADYKAKRKAEKQAFRHTLEVGSVLRCSWGYDQTNIDYFEVTAIIGAKMVEVREISQESEETGFMQGKCVPVPGNYVGQPMRKRVKEGNAVQIHSFSNAYLVEPKVIAGAKVYSSSHYTSYA